MRCVPVRRASTASRSRIQSWKSKAIRAGRLRVEAFDAGVAVVRGAVAGGCEDPLVPKVGVEAAQAAQTPVAGPQAV